MIRSRPQDPVTRALRELPREEASDRFTTEVMERLDARSATPSVGGWLWIPATAVLLALAVGIPALSELGQRRRTAEIQQQALALERKLAQIKTDYSKDRAIVYLGGDDQVDLVLDLLPLAENLASGDVRPASYAPER